MNSRAPFLLAVGLATLVVTIAAVAIDAGFGPEPQVEDAIAAGNGRGKKTKTPVPPPTATRTATRTNTPAPATSTPTPGAATITPVAATSTATAPAGDPVVLAAGDIASCSSTGDEATANLLDTLAGTVITLGDNVYDNGTITEYNNCYGPSWGRHKARTRPSAGNHEYNSGGGGYYVYFGAAAGDPAKGYYSYDLGAWHIIVLNSNCSAIGGCGTGSPQEAWLRADLAANPTTCTMAYWHHPRWSSGASHGNTTGMQDFWEALYDFEVDLVLNGHEHNYERFGPQSPTGLPDAAGIVEFVVGTGGRSHYGFGTPKANSLVRNGDTYGVLKLTLRATSYDFTFVPVAGQTFTDSGSGSCH